MTSRPIHVIDAQIHVWKASTPDRPWPHDAIEPQRAEPLEIPEVRRRMADAGVAGALLLGPTWEGSRNDYVLQAAAEDPAVFGAICRYATGDPAAVERLADWRTTTGMRAIRMSLNRGDVAGTLGAAHESGFFSVAERHGIPLSIYAPGRYRLYRELAERYPALKITVDHAALDSIETSLSDAVAPLKALAVYPGITVKASALPCFVDEEYPYRSISEAVYRLVEAFGAERVFFGSDLSRLPVPYGKLVDVFVDHVPELSEDERVLVAGGALTAWLGWTEPFRG
ncbi:amidohydrolase family protein [Aeromicrobium sp. YIM 150415]|uniref:amidohydrolase family protein n=1 Tax=Aeromicrobium sp. YIM 150415 TaxID=2803912 RepID=UPI00196261F2|nr:amidohydrolase family protein [Aeromicrobium sp. YIM 150415]MBM9464080.1 amidohydrolase family protein [Aeromicrobium sp. YIM 150415]